MGQPHKHAELIKAWADGAEIQCEISLGHWCDIGRPDWHEEVKFRIKPEPPKYPQTRMTDDDLWNIATTPITSDGGTTMRRVLANTAIARAIEDGQVIPLDEHVKEMGDAYLQGNDTGRKDMVPAAMLEEVARDAAAYGYNQAGGHVGLYLGSDFYDLIAKVKEGK